MHWKKLAVIGLLVLSMFIVSCGTDDSAGPSLSGVWTKVQEIASLKFLCSTIGATSLKQKDCGAGDNIVALMRVIVCIMVFSLIFVGVNMTGLSRTIAIVISLALTIMTVIFIPPQILVAVGGAYATIFSFILVGIPVFAGGIALYMIPSENGWQIGLKLAIIGLLLWVLIAVKDHALAITGFK